MIPPEDSTDPTSRRIALSSPQVLGAYRERTSPAPTRTAPRTMELAAECKSASVPPAVAITPKPGRMFIASEPVSAAAKPWSRAYSSRLIRPSRRSLSISIVTFMGALEHSKVGEGGWEQYLCRGKEGEREE